jgi:meso-butanediol dehydrogenase/(S,S)-butanediol dehydrogenase/diacetyl reductase
MGRFSSKCAVITGGNRGIGYAIAQRFVSEGANVIIASIEEQVIEAATALGDTAKSFVCNVADQSQVVDLYNLRKRNLEELTSQSRTLASLPSPRWKI